MSYFAILTFDLKNASADDYQNAYADLAGIGFFKTLQVEGGRMIQLPTTTTAGQFTGLDTQRVRDDLLEQVREVFSARGFHFEIFVSICENWAWGHSIT